VLVNKITRDFLLEIQKTRRVFLEGNILKIIQAEDGDAEFIDYLKEALEKDKSSRKKRLEITKQVQEQNADLLSWQRENQHLTDNLKDALTNAENAKSDALIAKEEAERERQNSEDLRLEAEKAKEIALSDLDIIQKKSQTELISIIVKVNKLINYSIIINICIKCKIRRSSNFRYNTWNISISSNWNATYYCLIWLIYSLSCSKYIIIC
jgi:hypothetical protein